MKRKLLLMTAALLCTVGTWADGYADYLTPANGWSRVTNASEIVTDGSAVYVLGLTSETSRVIALASENASTQVTTSVINGQPNRTQVWYIEEDKYNSNSGYAFKSLSNSEKYLQSASQAWNIKAESDNKGKAETCYTISIDAETYNLTISTNSNIWTDAGRSWGWWNPENPANDSYNLAGNKSEGLTFALFKKNLGVAGQDYTLLVGNPGFEAGNTSGWTYPTTGTRGDLGDHGAKSTANDTYKMTNSDGDYLFNIHPWGYAIKQTISNIPNGKYTVTAVVASNSSETDPSKVYLLANNDHNGITCDKSAGIGVEGSISTVVTNGSLTIGAVGSNNDATRSYLAEGLWWYKVDNFQLTYYGNAVGTVSTTFTSNTSATGGSWYNFTITYPGLYKITSSATANIYYSQNESDDADETEDYIAIAASGSTTMELSSGTFYFKSSETSTIKIEALETDMTSVITNPSFETGDNTGWSYAADGGYTNWYDALKTGSLVEGGGSYYKNYWAQNTNGKVYQTKSLPAGSYKLSAYVSTSTGQTIRLKAGSATTTRIAENGDPFKMEVTFTLASQQNVEISVGSPVAGAWYNMDDFRLTYYDPNENRSKIRANYGDITSMINGEFETDLTGWTGGSHVTSLARSWRSGSDTNKFMERTADGDMTCTLSNMPAGTYKVVAAARAAEGCKITPQIAGTNGATLTGVGDTQSAASEINMNGVQMPYSNLGGFTTNDWGHNWQWISAIGTLSSAGDLVIKFTCDKSGNTGNGTWMPIDDVHLYCTELEGKSYTASLGTVSGNTSVDNTGNASVVTCDIVMSNPNAIISSSSDINGAAGTQINNNLVSGTIANMVLYDGNAYTSPDDAYAITAATYYRNIAADAKATLMLPFALDATSKAKGTAYAPTRFANDNVSFTSVENPAADVPYVFVPSGDAVTTLTGSRSSAEEGTKQVEGTNVTLYGTYASTTITPNANNYIASQGKLWLVDNAQNSNPFRAYLNVTTPSPVKALTFSFDNETAVSTVEAETGKATIYNLAGQRVNKAQKGLYIVNGKKTYIK